MLHPLTSMITCVPCQFLDCKDSKNIGNLVDSLLDQVSLSYETNMVNLSEVIGLHLLLRNRMMVTSLLRLCSPAKEVVESITELMKYLYSVLPYSNPGKSSTTIAPNYVSKRACCP
ncbi:hypothetical protein C1H46_001028 [Malus baccata]|uniref:Uncharacterized protein n=1 Tax=Malus baccata TaxID=106549 RepID=A0A540NR12_MALBA|nr:hypothetical protein C1H46_001028 [Malus baccata]